MKLYQAKLFIEAVIGSIPQKPLDDNSNKKKNMSDFKAKLLASKRMATMKRNRTVKPNINIQNKEI